MILDTHGFQLMGARKNQEDRHAIVHLSSGVLAVVADGMGGHAAGEVAAQTAVDVVADTSRPRRLADRFRDANTKVLALGAADRERRGLGCTLTALGVFNWTRATNLHGEGPEAHWCHLGDSRVTLIREGQLRWLTHDHSIPGAMLEAGHLTEEEFDRGEGHDGLIQFVGMPCRPEDLLIEEGRISVLPGDVLLLTTDGVHGALRRHVVLAIVRRSKGARSIAEALVRAAVEVGGRNADNATCVAIVVGAASP